MSEAEKKWVQYDKEQNYRRDMLNEDISSDSREAYKSALRREIEKMKQDERDYKTYQAYQRILELLDIVDP